MEGAATTEVTMSAKGHKGLAPATKAEAVRGTKTDVAEREAAAAMR